jgi:hydroxypyruvate isomerase
MDTLELARHAKEIGLVGIEGVDRKYYPALREMGLEISLVSSHGFANGPCNPRFREEVIEKLNEAIDVAADVGCKKVITFT